VFYPPRTLCTAGLDGKVCLWSLDTGKSMGILYRAPPRPPPPSVCHDVAAYQGALALGTCVGSPRDASCAAASVRARGVC